MRQKIARTATAVAASNWLTPGAAWAQPPYGPEWGAHPMWGTWGIGMMLIMLLFWGAVIVGLLFGIRWLL